MEKPENTRVKSFRLGVSVVENFDRAARRAQMTENGFLAALLAERLLIDPLVPAFQEVTLSATAFQSILNATNADALEAAGSDIAQRDVPLMNELFESNGRTFNLQILIDILGKHGRWFYVEGNVSLTRGWLTLRHGYGFRWSKFLQAYLVTASGLLSKGTINVKIGDQFVRVSFKANY